MPEGHTIHRLAHDLTKDLSGKSVQVTSPNGRFTQAPLIDGETVNTASAIGKHLLIAFDERYLHIHLGRFGKLRRTPGALPPKPTARLRLASAEAVWEMTGAIQCELIESADVDTLRGRIGADPLSDAPRPAATWERFHGTKRGVGAVLLDQSIFSGIGNVYRAEILFMLGLNPLMPAVTIDKPTFERIWRLTRTLLAKGVETNRIITVKGATAKTSRRNALHVYKRKTCRVCDSPIRTLTSGGRALYFCPV
ncbi:MAG: Fpg/Nei family DNA glycosylase, partial [Clostridia bacterium]|nr:Fpg/Nei family DNA glycosylase [Deltaproteobacteria bacterium]